MSFNYSPKIVTNGLVLYLDAANPKSYVSGSTVWNDMSANQLVCNLGANTLYTSSNLGGIFFSGSNASISNHPLINFGTGSFSIELITYINNTNHYVLNKAGFGGGRGYGVAIVSNQLYFGLQGDTNYNSSILLSTAGISSNNYYHIILVCDRQNTDALFYINNSLKTTNDISSQSGSLDSNSTLFIGSNYSPLPNQIRYVTRLYNRALSAQEVTQNYNATKGRFGL